MSPSYHNQLFSFLPNNKYKRNKIIASFGVFLLAKRWSLEVPLYLEKLPRFSFLMRFL